MGIVNSLKSLRTTIIGVIAGLMIALPQISNLLDGNDETIFSYKILLAGIAAMGFGIVAKDGDKSTEDVS